MYWRPLNISKCLWKRPQIAKSYDSDATMERKNMTINASKNFF
jgi:hypothetical protein